MSQIQSILQQRTKAKEQPKMAAMTERSMSGQLATFAGVFTVQDLAEHEQEEIRQILEKFAINSDTLAQDLFSLNALTAEVRAINNQAALLHGARIKKAQDLLKKYKEGAFTAWLITAYGNRQTPYNFLQYHEFYNTVPKEEQNLVDNLPRQAIYSLASRKAPLQDKLALMKTVKGQSKRQILTTMRSFFPLDEQDKRRSDAAKNAAELLKQAHSLLIEAQIEGGQKKPLKKLTYRILKLLKENSNAQ